MKIKENYLLKVNNDDIKDGVFVLPKNIVTISRYAFYNCSLLEKIVFNDEIKEIEDYAFYRCINLKEIILPSSITRINKCLFYKCKSLKSINIGININRIEEYAFAYCSSLESIKIPSSVTYIGNDAFVGCTKMKKAVLNCAITELNDCVFDGCLELSSIYLPNTIETINGYAFYKCVSLKRFYLPNNLKIIREGAFKKCSGLSEIIFNKNIFEIGDLAFQKCDSLKEFNIPNSIEIIGYHVFYECKNLRNIYIESKENKKGWEDFGVTDCNLKYGCDLTKISKKTINACGAIAYTVVSGKILYIVVKNKRNVCGFPKGLIEEGESKTDTIKRELEEELSINIELDENFKETIEYEQPEFNRIKQVVYFVGKYSNQNIKIQEEELNDVFVVQFDEAIKLINENNTLSLFKRANKYIIDKEKRMGSI